MKYHPKNNTTYFSGSIDLSQIIFDIQEYFLYVIKLKISHT